MRAQLIPTSGGRSIELTKELTVIGRKKDCDLRLPHKAVSKYHCVVVKTSGVLLLRDLGSTNGTLVNGQRVRRAALLPNDQLKIAGFRFRVFFGPDNAQPPPDDEHTQPLEPKELPLARKHDDDDHPLAGQNGSSFDFDKINMLLDSEADKDD